MRNLQLRNNMSLALPDLVLAARPRLAEQLLCLRRRWRMLLGCTLVVFGLTSFVLAHLPLTYTATGILLYAPEKATVPDGPAMPSVSNEDAVTASQSAVIASLPVARALVTQLNLAAQPGFRDILKPAPWPLNLLGGPAGQGANGLAEAARRALHVAVVPGSDVLTSAILTNESRIRPNVFEVVSFQAYAQAYVLVSDRSF
jgi:polysaccharide biosynthesis transport protein